MAKPSASRARRRSLICRTLLLLAVSGCDQATAPQASVESWESIPLDTGASFNAVYFSDAQNGWLAGGSHLPQGGLLGSTTDGGLHWSFVSRIANSRAKHLTSIHFFSGRRGVVGTDNGEILATIDGGRSWETTLKVSDRFGNRVSHFAAWSSRVAYAVIGDHVIRTDDRGASWHCLTAAATSCPAAPECRDAGFNPDLNASAIALMSPARIAIVSDRTAVAISEDGGCSWRKARSLTGQDRVRLNALYFADQDYGWAVGDKGFIAATSDGGRQWRVQNAAVAADLTAVRFVDRSSGFLLGQRPNRAGSVVLSTRDGGENWKLEQAMENDLLNHLFVSQSGTIWAAGGVLDVTRGQHLLRKVPASGATAGQP